jgi:Tol biopolymer transport system component/predicted Ser/Thr protein kinase
MIGRTLAHYQIVQEIGSGGMGVVYKARDLHLDRFVALKTLPPERVADPDRKRRFVQEAKAASALNHPSIVHIYDIASNEGVDFIAMEYVEGKTLQERIGRRGLPFSETLKYAIQVADALAKAHSVGIIHRDLKPSNIMVNEDGIVKVLDFGLAKLSEQTQGDEFITSTATAAEERPVTEKGTIVGTVAYMSPEQAEGKPVDSRSDIFSFGSVLYEMITGRRAFQGANKISTLSAILSKEPAPVGLDIPHDLEKTVTRCLRKDPSRRFQNMADLKVALEELKEESDSQHQTSIMAPHKTAPNWTRFLPKTVIILVLLIAGLAIITWFYLRSRSSHDRGSFSSEVAPGGNLALFVSSSGGASQPSLSPDGKMLAFVAEANGRTDLFVGRVAGGERIRLTNDDAEESMPSFSPDGERIAYTRLGSEAKLSELRVVPTLGGQAVRVMDNALDAAWSPDGKRLAFIWRRPGEPDILAVSAADGTDVSAILKCDAALPFFRTPSWSPNGKSLAVGRSSGGSASELWLVPLAGSPPRRLSNDPPGVFSNKPVFTPDGRGVVHSSNRAGATNLWILPLDGGQPVRLTSGPGPDSTPSIARDGLIAFVNARSRSSLIVHNLASGQGREILAHSSYMWAPAFSPSGLELAFSRTEQDGSWHIWIVPIRGGAPRQLTSGTLPEIYPRFTPDGASIIYSTWSSGPDRIWRVPRAGGPPVALTPARNEDDQYGDISPDGRWLAFARTENKITRIYVAAVNGGETRRLTDSPSTVPRWSPNGQWIAFSPSRGYLDGTFVIRADGTGMRRLSETGGWPVWWPDGKQLGYQNVGKDGSEEYCVVPIKGGLPKTIPSIRFGGTNHPFDVSPDGACIAVATAETISSDIWLLYPHR